MFRLDARHVYQDEYHGFFHGDCSSPENDHGLQFTELRGGRGFLAEERIKGYYFSGKGLTKEEALSNMDDYIERYYKDHWSYLYVKRNPIKQMLLALL